jgi:hypothetical protein
MLSDLGIASSRMLSPKPRFPTILAYIEKQASISFFGSSPPMIE